MFIFKRKLMNIDIFKLFHWVIQAQKRDLWFLSFLIFCICVLYLLFSRHVTQGACLRSTLDTRKNMKYYVHVMHTHGCGAGFRECSKTTAPVWSRLPPGKQTKTYLQFHPSQECDLKSITLEFPEQHYRCNLQDKTSAIPPPAKGNLAKKTFFFWKYLSYPAWFLFTNDLHFVQLLWAPLYLLILDGMHTDSQITHESQLVLSIYLVQFLFLNRRNSLKCTPTVFSL